MEQYLKASQHVVLEKGAREWLAYALVGHEVAHKQFKPEKLLGVFDISSFGVLGFNKTGTDLLATHFDELPADVQEWMEEAYVVATALTAQGWAVQEHIGAFLDLNSDDVVGSNKTNKHRDVMRVIKNLLKQGDVKPKDALTHMLHGLKAEDKLTPSLNNLATKLNISA